MKVAQHITYVMRPTYRQPSEWVLCYVMLCYVMLCYVMRLRRRAGGRKKWADLAKGALF